MVRRSCFFLCLFFWAEALQAQVVDEIDFFRRGVDRLVIDPGFGNVIITQSEDGLTRVRGRISGGVSKRHYYFESGINNKFLSLAVISPLSTRNDVKAELYISLPLQKGLLIKNATGIVTLINYRSEDITMQANSGTIKVDKSTGNFDISSNSGRVMIASSDGDFKVTSGGDINLENLSGAFDIHSLHGNIMTRHIVAERNSYFKAPNGQSTLDLVQPESFFSGDFYSSDRKIIAYNGKLKHEEHYRKNIGKIYLLVEAADSVICHFRAP